MGPLQGVRVVEFAGLGPGPFCGMLLADLGADVVRIDRRGRRGGLMGALGATSLLDRGKRSIALDLKDADDLRRGPGAGARAPTSCSRASGPASWSGWASGPTSCWPSNPALVYGRMTGWGQTGPLARSAGHDIGYIALTGALGASGRPDERPGAADEPARRLRRRGSVPRPRARWPRCCTRARRARARWWTPRSSTAPPS